MQASLSEWKIPIQCMCTRNLLFVFEQLLFV